MVKANAQSFVIFPATKKCSCGAEWSRHMDPVTKKYLPVCDDCGDTPCAYKVEKWIKNKVLDFYFFPDGRQLRSIDDCYTLGRIIFERIQKGEYRREDFVGHKKRPLTFGRFIETLLKSERSASILAPEEKEFAEDFMAPYFIDIPSSKAKLDDFLEDMALMRDVYRREKFDLATGVWTKLQHTIGQDEEGVA